MSKALEILKNRLETDCPNFHWHEGSPLEASLLAAMQEFAQSLLPTDQAAPTELKVVDSSFGGCTGINDYILNDGQVITCRPSELASKLAALQSVVAPKTDEEIEQLAKKFYPDNMGGIGSSGVERYRAGYKGGYKAALQSLEKEPADRWIAVSERLPEYNKGVLVFIPDEDYHVTSGMWDVSNKWVLLDEYRKPECEVTHWAELMDIPEEYRKQREEGYKAMRLLKELTPPLPSAPKTITE